MADADLLMGKGFSVCRPRSGLGSQVCSVSKQIGPDGELTFSNLPGPALVPGLMVTPHPVAPTLDKRFVGFARQHDRDI